jgi:alanyl aminopeptidase
MHTVELSIDPAAETFQGHMRIEVEVRTPSSELWVEGKGLAIASAEVVVSQRTLKPNVVTSGGEFIGLILREPLQGLATLVFRYQGHLDDKGLAGPYRHKVGSDWYVFTTFTPIDARRAFPCFDDLRFKTPWAISIRAPQGNRAVSNGGEQSIVEEPGGWTRTTFATTAPLPAEVVAFAVGPFDFLDAGQAGAGTAMRIITPRGLATQGQAAAQGAAALLPKLEAYTGTPYAFGKLDHLALPEGAFGAVENPGLITYRIEGLLAAPDKDTPAKRKAIRSLEAHEMAHQWFGDLVTQSDWRDVWLSEGFATWLSNKIIGEEQPPGRAPLFAIDARERIMNLDASSRTRPVRFAVDSRDSAANIYNRLVYDKAGAVLMMLEAWIGEEKFQNGLRGYLQHHRFGNASLDDLATDLRQATGMDPGPVLHGLLDTTGVPSVRVDADCARHRLRVLKSGAGPLPVCWRTDTGRACEMVDRPVTEGQLAACPAWIFPNVDGTGYYRTVWSEAQLAALRLEQLTPAERLTLAYDLHAQKENRAGAAVLRKLLNDGEPEVAAAARAALK